LGAEAFEALFARGGDHEGLSGYGVLILVVACGDCSGSICEDCSRRRPSRHRPEVRAMAVLLLGTLDTKGVEYAFVRDLLAQRGVPTLTMDAGVLRPPLFAPDVPRDEVYAAAGTTAAAIQQAADRRRAIEAAARGVARLARDLHSQGRVTGVLALGGSAGTTIGTAAMRALPFGVPKLMVSTLASGQVQPYVGVRDILMMHSVVDISGLNRISRRVLTNAALAL